MRSGYTYKGHDLDLVHKRKAFFRYGTSCDSSNCFPSTTPTTATTCPYPIFHLVCPILYFIPNSASPPMNIYQSHKSSLEASLQPRAVHAAGTYFTAWYAAVVDGKRHGNTYGVTRPRKSVHGAFPIVLGSLVFISDYEHYWGAQREPKLRATVYFHQVLFVPRRC